MNLIPKSFQLNNKLGISQTETVPTSVCSFREITAGEAKQTQDGQDGVLYCFKCTEYHPIEDGNTYYEVETIAQTHYTAILNAACEVEFEVFDLEPEIAKVI